EALALVVDTCEQADVGPTGGYRLRLPAMYLRASDELGERLLRSHLDHPLRLEHAAADGGRGHRVADEALVADDLDRLEETSVPRDVVGDRRQDRSREPTHEAGHGAVDVGGRLRRGAVEVEADRVVELGHLEHDLVDLVD